MPICIPNFKVKTFKTSTTAAERAHYKEKQLKILKANNVDYDSIKYKDLSSATKKKIRKEILELFKYTYDVFTEKYLWQLALVSINSCFKKNKCI